MHGMFALLNLLPSHLLVPQLALSSSRSNGALFSAVFPVMLFPREFKVTQIPSLLKLLLVVLAWMSLLLPSTKIPPPSPLAVLLTITLLLGKPQELEANPGGDRLQPSRRQRRIARRDVGG
jgi:hypothetical protein